MINQRHDVVEKRKRFQADPESFIELKDVVLVVMEPKPGQNVQDCIKDSCKSGAETHVVVGEVTDYFRKKRDYMSLLAFKKKEKEEKEGIKIVSTMPKELKS